MSVKCRKNAIDIFDIFVAFTRDNDLRDNPSPALINIPRLEFRPTPTRKIGSDGAARPDVEIVLPVHCSSIPCGSPRSIPTNLRPYRTNDTPTNTTCESMPGLMRPRLALEM
jgi:hypothetical protein